MGGRPSRPLTDDTRSPNERFREIDNQYVQNEIKHEVMLYIQGKNEDQFVSQLKKIEPDPKRRRKFLEPIIKNINQKLQVMQYLQKQTNQQDPITQKNNKQQTKKK